MTPEGKEVIVEGVRKGEVTAAVRYTSRRIILFESSQTSTTCPTDKKSMKVEVTELREVVACDSPRGFV